MKVLIHSKNSRNFAMNLVRNIRQEDCPMVMTLEPPVDKKTDEQRSLFHVLCRSMAKDTGYSEGQIKEIVKRHILGTAIIDIGGRQYEVTSSSEIADDGKPRDKVSYSQLIEGIHEIAARAGIAL